MPRPKRILIPGTTYHVYSEGEAHRTLFKDESDRQCWITLMREARERFGCRFLAYCLIPNGIHMLVETPNPNLNKVMEHLKRSYARFFNRRHGIKGHLFGTRYTARPVEKKAYLLPLVRYFHFLPVTEGLAADVFDYAWSSHPYYIGRKADSLVDCKEALALLHADPEIAKMKYLGYLQVPVPKKEWRKLGSTRNGILGDRNALSSLQDRNKPDPLTPREPPAALPGGAT